MGIIILMIATGLYRMLLGHTNYLIRSDMSLRWYVRGVKRTWGETYVGWNVRGVKRTWGETYVGWNVRGVKRTGMKCPGMKCHVTSYLIQAIFKLTVETIKIFEKNNWYMQK